MFRKKAPADPQTLTESWAVSQGTYDGKPLITRFNIGLRQAAGHAAYSIQIGVAVPLKAPDARGLPTSDESAELILIEEELERLVGTRAILVGVITTSGMREFILYTGEGDWIAQFHQDLQAAVSHHEVQVMAQRDEDWATYRRMVESKRDN